MSLYAADYYAALRGGSRRSAEVVVPIILELVHPRSVVDVGCGTGSWLAVFRQHGIEDILGVDGAHVSPELLEIPRDRFLPRDLSRPLRLGRTFDLAICAEVAEHLPPDCAGTLVESLTRLAPVVVFSAAIPYQGSTYHCNEQWPEYWTRRFGASGYIVCDEVRRRIWGDARVEWWYAQNLLVFAEASRVHAYPALSRAQHPLSIVHPRAYLHLCTRLGATVRPFGIDTDADVRDGFLRRWLRKGRLQFWRLTGLWVTRVGRGSQRCVRPS